MAMECNRIHHFGGIAAHFCHSADPPHNAVEQKAAAVPAGLFLAYRSLRDALVPEKRALAQSIHSQLPYPDEAPR